MAAPILKLVPVVPEALSIRLQWVLWKYEHRAGTDKPTKVPYNPRTGRSRASSTNPETWGTFVQAASWYKRGTFDGIGYVFTKEDPFTGIDLDHCIDPVTGAMTPLAQRILAQLNSYTEISPSGTGLHIIVQGKLPGDNRVSHDQGIEVYDHEKYFTITGRHYGAALPIIDCTEALAALYADLFPAPEASSTRQTPRANTQSDEDLLRLATHATDGPKFAALWHGNTTGYASASEADLALCNFLAFYTGETGRADALFRQSGLMRDKWDERHRSDGRTYGQVTIDRAFEGRSAFYQPRERTQSGPPPASGQRERTEKNHRIADDGQAPEQEAEADKEPPRYRFLTDDEIDHLPPISWLIDGIIPERGIGAIYGESQSCKTFFLLDMALCVALGKPWKGFAPQQGHVGYIAGEDPYGVAERYRIWKHYYQTARVPGFHLLPENVPLMLGADVYHLYQAIEALPEIPHLLIIDTLSCAMLGGDGNNTKDMIAFMEVVKAIRTRYQCTVLLAHHKNKNGSELGNVSLRNSCDVMIDMSHNGDVVTAKCEKIKNGRPFKDLFMTLRTHETSAVLVARSGEIESGRLPDTHAKVLMVLRDTFPNGATYISWSKATGIVESTFARIIAALKQAGYVSDTQGRRGEQYTVTSLGKSYSHHSHESDIGA